MLPSSSPFLPSATPPTPPPTSPPSCLPQQPQAGASTRTPPRRSPPVPPAWLFPPFIPPVAKSLLVSLLLPNPSRRKSVEQALSHPWLVGGRDQDGAGRDGISSVPDRAFLISGGRDSAAASSAAVTSSMPRGAGAASPATAPTGEATASVAGREGTRHPRSGLGAPSARNLLPSHRARGEERGGGRGRRGEEAKEGRGGNGALQGGQLGSRQGWRAEMAPEEWLSCGSLPSTTSFP